jgi:hypothetical protein
MKNWIHLSFAFALTSSLFVGCNAEVADSKKAGVAAPKAQTPDSPALSEKAMLTLASADKLDGKEDHVVELCYLCGLGMEGKKDYTATVGEYSAHFCSKGCCDEFKAAPEKIILETELPKAK